MRRRAERFEATGQVPWIAQRLAVKERRARLLGLDAPKRSDVNVSTPTLKIVELPADVLDMA